MIFWRLIILSGQNDCKFNYMLTVCLGSFHCIALHVFTVYNFKCNYGACFLSMVPFFLHRSSPEKQIVIRKISLETYSILFFSFFNWEIIFFLSNDYKPILSVGKGKNLRNPNLANTHKCNCHDMNWNDMDIQKVLLLIKEHGTSLFNFKLYFPSRSATLRENFSRDCGIEEPFLEASLEASDFENAPSKENIFRLKKPQQISY